MQFFLRFTFYTSVIFIIFATDMEREFVIDNKTSFHQIYMEYYQALVVYSMSFTLSQEAAEDMVQDIFSSLWNKKREFQHKSMLKAFLYNSVRNRSVDYLRHKQVEEKNISHILENTSSFHLDDQERESIFTEEVYRQLYEYISRFPPRQREIFRLTLQGKTNAEIAEAMDIAPGTVRTQKRRGIDALRKNMTMESFLLLALIADNI